MDIIILHKRDDGSFVIAGPEGPYHVTADDPLHAACVVEAEGKTYPPEPGPEPFPVDFAAPIPATSPYGIIRAALTPQERETLSVRLTSTGSANRALQGVRDDAVAGLPVTADEIMSAMVAAKVIDEARKAELEASL